MTVVKYIRVTKELESLIAALAETEGRSWSNMVVRLLQSALKGRKR